MEYFIWLTLYVFISNNSTSLFIFSFFCLHLGREDGTLSRINNQKHLVNEGHFVCKRLCSKDSKSKIQGFEFKILLPMAVLPCYIQLLYKHHEGMF